MRYLIFKNVKRWLIEYGVDVLDLLMNPANLETTSPKERYQDNLNSFFEELDRHFSYAPFYKGNFKSHLPILLVHVHDLGETSGCNHQYMLEFTYHYTTVSASQEYLICNTPEELLRLEDDLNCALTNMMHSVNLADFGTYSRTLFTDMQHVEGFNDVIKKVHRIQDYALEHISTIDEVHTLNKSFILTIGEC